MSLAAGGGDEFLVVISANPAEARQVVTRLIASIGDAPIATTEGPVFATITGGLSPWGKGEKLDTAIRRADEALYSAKASGRGEFAVADTA